MSRNLLFILGIALAGCNGASSLNAASAAPEQATAASASQPATELTLRFDETVSYRDLSIRWLEVEDSRCAIGVTCVWAGQMGATLEIHQDGSAPVEVKLLTRVGREPVVTEVAGYALSLLGITPHPKQNVTVQRDAYALRISIVKL